MLYVWVSEHKLLQNFTDVDMNKDLIISNINKAEHSINIAVSWFTDIDIISALIEKAKEQIIIKIILSNSNWNLIRYDQYKILSSLGVAIYKKGEKEPGKGNFMHCKFCIVDEKVSIHGSYNWTKLGNTNDENLEVIQDYEKARSFIKQFHSLLKDSKDFFLNLEIEKLNDLISQYQNMENNSIEPNDDLQIDKVLNPPNLVKVKPTLPEQSESILKVEKLDQLKEADFNQIKKISFRGNLKLISYTYIDWKFSMLTLSSDTYNGNNPYSFLIENLILREGLINSDEKFKIFFSRLNGFPDVLLTMVMLDKVISLVATIEFEEKKNKYILLRPDSDLLTIKFNNSLSTDSQSNHVNKLVPMGVKYFWDVIEGKISRTDLEQLFLSINWI